MRGTQPLSRHLAVVAVVAAGVFAQAPAAQTTVLLTKAVPLVSDTCPVAAAGGVISFNWNPGFDHAGAVTGLRSIHLVFYHVGEDGVHANPMDRLVVDSSGGVVSDGVNGSYRIEVHLPQSAAVVHAGTYQLAEAHASPQLVASFRGEEPVATVPLARERYCMTVIPVSRPTVPIVAGTIAN